MNSKGYFITGTDTGVGKTVVSAIVAKKLKLPITSQYNVD